MKQTAVEWLIEQIKSDQNQRALSAKEWVGVFEKAKEMEKQMVVDIVEKSRATGLTAEYLLLTYGSKGSAELGQSLEWDGEVTQGIDNHVPDVRKMVEISDEEIEEMLFHHSNEYAYGFRDAIKWYREQLKQRQ